jgi:DNA-binding IclR family transcriptional regulator
MPTLKDIRRVTKVSVQWVVRDNLEGVYLEVLEFFDVLLHVRLIATSVACGDHLVYRNLCGSAIDND